MIRIIRHIARFSLVPIVIVTGSHEREVRRVLCEQGPTISLRSRSTTKSS